MLKTCQIKEVLKSLKRSDKIKDESREMSEKLKIENIRYLKALEEIEEYINNQGIDNKWNMRIQRFRSGILDIIRRAKGEE